jgi:hypothetical protein
MSFPQPRDGGPTVNFDYSEADEYEVDFAANRAIEFDDLDELDQSNTAIELRLLATRVQAARHCGA